jgi:hypothetical protein
MPAYCARRLVREVELVVDARRLAQPLGQFLCQINGLDVVLIATRLLPVRHGTADRGPPVQSPRRGIRAARRTGAGVALEVFWGSGSPFSWRVLLALEYKRVPYESRLLQFAKQEHKSPQMLRMNPRGRVPVLRDGEYIVFESLACLAYLDRKYPEPPIFGRSAEDAGTIMRVIASSWPTPSRRSTRSSGGVSGSTKPRKSPGAATVGGEARTIQPPVTGWSEPPSQLTVAFAAIMLLRRA